jgi:hypothetical protein
LAHGTKAMALLAVIETPARAIKPERRMSPLLL